MQNSNQLNRNTKILMQKLKTEPKSFEDKLQFAKYITQYIEMNKYDAEFIIRAISQLPTYAPIESKDWWEEELMNEIDKIAHYVTYFTTLPKKDDFKKIAPYLQQWLNSNEFLKQDYLRMMNGIVHPSEKDKQSNIRRFFDKSISYGTKENFEWFQSLGLDWIAPIDLVAFEYNNAYHNIREPLAAKFIKFIAKHLKDNYLGDKETKLYLQILKEYNKQIDPYTKTATYQLLSSYLDNTDNVSTEELRKYNHWLAKFAYQQFKSTNGKFYREFDKIFKREKYDHMQIALRYLFKQKTQQGEKISTPPSFFTVTGIENTVNLLIRQNQINIAKFELNYFFNHFRLNDDASEYIVFTYQKVLELKKEPWYLHTKPEEPDIAKLAQPAINYFNSLKY